METENLNPKCWSMILFGGFKTHFCPNELVGQLIADITAREGEVIRIKEAKEGGADRPGMVLMDRPWEDIQLENFKLGFPSQDFKYFMRLLETAPLRKFADGKEYYKIHGWVHCIIFTPEQRNFVLLKMEKMLLEVNQRCDEADERLMKARKNLENKRVLAPQLTIAPPPKDRN